MHEPKTLTFPIHLPDGSMICYFYIQPIHDELIMLKRFGVPEDEIEAVSQMRIRELIHRARPGTKVMTYTGVDELDHKELLSTMEIDFPVGMYARIRQLKGGEDDIEDFWKLEEGLTNPLVDIQELNEAANSQA